MRTIQVTIKGVTPLLMNKPAEYEFDSNIRVNNPNIDAEKDIKSKIYALNGIIYTPATHIRGALINAGKDLKVKGKGKSTYSKMLASMVEVQPEAIEHKKQNFDILVSRTVNPNTRGQNMTKRPRLKEWELDFDLLADEEIPLDVLHNALERAGKYVGIGDWRPQTKGIHGKFIVTSFKEAEAKD